MSREKFNKFGLHHVGGVAKEAAAAHVIFVHGLNGRGFDTWAADKSVPESYWPSWVAQDIQNIAVWTYSYDAAASFWKGNPEALRPTALTFLKHIETHDLAANSIVLIMHSLGGIIGKRLLRSLADVNHESASSFRAVAFFGTPHLGSPVGTQLNEKTDGIGGFVLRKTALAEVLDFSHSELMDLNTWFRGHWSGKPVRVYFEAEPLAIAGGSIKFGTIVPEGTADPGLIGVLAFPINSDHSDMCKFVSRESHDYSHILEFIRIHARPVSAPPNLASVSRKLFSVPFATLGDKFVGREIELKVLHEAVSKLNGTTAVMQTVSGLGGQGKTQLAIEYAYRYADEYTSIFWLDAESPESLQSGLAALCAAGKLNFPEKNAEKLSDQVSAVICWLAARSDWLVIADNANSAPARAKVIELFGTLPGKVLITTRPPKMEGNTRDLQLCALNRLAAVKLVVRWSDGGRAPLQTDDEDCTAIVDALDLHVLSLRVAAAYIKRRRLSFKQYLTHWSDLKTQYEILEWSGPAAEISYRLSTAKTFALTFAALPSDASTLLNWLAYLAPAPIPDLLWSTPRPSTHTGSATQIRDSTAALVDFELLSESSGGVVLHRVIGAVVRNGHSESDRRASEANVFSWLSAAVTTLDLRNRTHMAVAIEYSPHVDIALKSKLTGIELASITQWIGLLLWRVRLANCVGDFQIAREYLEMGVNAAGTPPPGANENGSVALLHWQLGEVHEMMSDFPDALSSFKCGSVIASRTKLRDPILEIYLHASTGHVLHKMDQITAAEKEFRAGLAIEHAIQSPNQHLNLAIRNDFALLLHQAGRFEEAEPLMRQVLELDIVQNVDIATRVLHNRNMGSLLMHMGHNDATKRQSSYLEAETFLNTAASLSDNHLEARNPTRLHTKQKFAELYTATGRQEDALVMIRAALLETTDILGPAHPDTAEIKMGVGSILSESGRVDEAKIEFTEAAKIFSERLGSGSIRLAVCLERFGFLLAKNKRYIDAEIQLRESLKIHGEFFAKNLRHHLSFSTAVNGYLETLTQLDIVESERRKRVESLIAPFQIQWGAKPILD
jgi:tetratricopeptide (TPR) repeat protein